MSFSDTNVTYGQVNTYTNYSGLSLPNYGDHAQTFLKPLFKIGDSTNKVSIGTTAIPLFHIYATSALSGAVYQRSMLLNQTQSVALGTGGFVRQLDVVFASEYNAGSDIAVIRAQADFGTAGHSHGICNVLTSEVKLMNGSVTRGAYYALELRVNAQASTSWASAGPVGFMRIRSAGTAAAVDTAAYFMIFNGHTAGATKLVSATSQTVKCSFSGEVPTTTVRYLLFSQYEDTLSIGLTGAKKTAITGVPEIAVWRTSALTSGSQDLMKLDWVQTANTTGYQKVLRATMNAVGYKLGSSAKVVYGALVCDAAGFTGYGACLAGDLTLGNGQLVHGGAYCLDLQMMDGANTAYGLGGPVGFINVNLNTTSAAATDDAAVLFNITAEAAAGNMVDTTANGTTDAWIKIKINAVDYFIMCSLVATEA